MKAKNLKIAFYIRVSTEEQAQNPEGSIKNQEERLRDAVRFKNMENNFGEVVEIFIDRAKSGKDTNRPALQKMLHAIKLKKINLVMVSELSRISRNMKDFAEIWELMKSCECGFFSLRENFDTTTAAGEMVLYTLANLAQFERRQVSERVAANMNARASRGLYNGGTIPVGYKKDHDKPGHLAVDMAHESLVKTCFQTFLTQGSLSQAARWLNEHKYRLPKKVEGGGNQMRLDTFTVDNLHHIITNRMYLGIREYKENGERKTVKALWPAIVDEETFLRVQGLLKKNKSSKKPIVEHRYPYILTGLVVCANCGDHLVGKSAHGKNGKFGYYEHSWATKRNSTLTEKIFRCEPHRILARKLEAFALEKISELFYRNDLAEELIAAANRNYLENSREKELQRLKAQIYGCNSQLEALTQRIAELPKSVSAKTFFSQMEKIEKTRTEYEEKYRDMEAESPMLEKPAVLKVYTAFLGLLKSFFKDADKAAQAEIIKRLIGKIEIGVDFVVVHFHVMDMHVQYELDSAKQTLEAFKKKNPDEESPSPGSNANGISEDFVVSYPPIAPFKHRCSNSLTDGARKRT